MVKSTGASYSFYSTLNNIIYDSDSLLTYRHYLKHFRIKFNCEQHGYNFPGQKRIYTFWQMLHTQLPPLTGTTCPPGYSLCCFRPLADWQTFPHSWDIVICIQHNPSQLSVHGFFFDFSIPFILSRLSHIHSMSAPSIHPH